MILPIGNVLSPSEIDEVRIEFAAIRFEDGRSTAGWSAKLVKNNRQAAPGARSEALRQNLAERILANEVFAAAVRPKALTPLLISRYQPGQAYGSHIDDALIGGLRTDVSFTLFLAAPESYEGGELVIEGASGDERIKLPAGSLIAYPSTSLHHVAPVTEGERLAAVAGHAASSATAASAKSCSTSTAPGAPCSAAKARRPSSTSCRNRSPTWSGCGRTTDVCPQTAAKVLSCCAS
jgi:PKHD-type hydroxylase